MRLFLAYSNVIQVKGNLLKQLSDYFQFWPGNEGQGLGVHFRNEAIRWQISKFINLIFGIFALALIISEILTFQIFYLGKVGHGLGVQLLQWWYSMANIKICKRYTLHFSFAFTIFELLTFQLFDFEKVGQGHWIQTSWWCYLMANIKIYSYPNILSLCSISHRFWGIKI